MFWLDALARGDSVPADLKAWAKRFPDVLTAWDSCSRADWLVWIAGRLPDPTVEEQHRILRAAVAIEPLEEAVSSWLPRILLPMPRALDVAQKIAYGRPARLDAADLIVAVESGFLIAIVLVVCLKVMGSPLMKSTAAEVGITVAATVAATAMMAALRAVVYAMHLRSMTFREALDVLYARSVVASRASSPERLDNLATITRHALSFVPGRLAGHS